MELTFDVGIVGIVAAAAVAVILGIVVQLAGEARFGYEWVITGVAAFAGALVASEWIVAWQTFAPVHDGLAVVPALIGGVVVGVVVGGASRLVEARTLRANHS